MSEELKLCPFCGGRTAIEHDEFGTFIRCVNIHCALVGLTMVIDCWNTRPIEDQLNKELQVFQNAGLEYKQERDALQIRVDKLEYILFDTKDVLNSIRDYRVIIGDEGIYQSLMDLLKRLRVQYE
jgi:hypothetical protein